MKLIVQEFVWKVSLNKFDDMLYLCIIKMHITRHRHRTLSVLLRGFVCMRSPLSARLYANPARGNLNREDPMPPVPVHAREFGLASWI